VYEIKKKKLRQPKKENDMYHWNQESSVPFPSQKK